MIYVMAFFVCDVKGCECKQEFLIPLRYGSQQGHGMVVDLTQFPDGWHRIGSKQHELKSVKGFITPIFCPDHAIKKKLRG